MKTKIIISALIIFLMLVGTASAEIFIKDGNSDIKKDDWITQVLRLLTIQSLPTTTFTVEPSKTFPLTYQFCAWQGTYTEVSQVITVSFNGDTISNTNYAIPIGTCNPSITVQITAPSTIGTYYGEVKQTPTFSPSTSGGVTTKQFTVIVQSPTPVPTTPNPTSTTPVPTSTTPNPTQTTPTGTQTPNTGTCPSGYMWDSNYETCRPIIDMLTSGSSTIYIVIGAGLLAGLYLLKRKDIKW